MAEGPKEYDANSYGDYELVLVYRLHRLLFFLFNFHMKMYVISMNIYRFQLMGMIASVVIKMISRYKVCHNLMLMIDDRPACI
jgi:hypothetical protein